MEDVKLTLEDLQTALTAAGVAHFTAEEITYLPKSKREKHIVPQGELFQNMVNVAFLAEAIRTTLQAPLTVSSGYRPEWYNTAVSGAPNSAHLRAAALDLNATSSNDALRLRSIAEAMWKQRVGRFAGLGFYKNVPRRIHIDVMHEGGKGHRRWSK